MKKAIYLLSAIILFSCNGKSNSELILGSWTTEDKLTYTFLENGVATISKEGNIGKTNAVYQLVNNDKTLQFGIVTIALNGSAKKNYDQELQIDKLDSDSMILIIREGRIALVKTK